MKKVVAALNGASSPSFKNATIVANCKRNTGFRIPLHIINLKAEEIRLLCS